MAQSKQEIIEIVNDGFRKNDPEIFLNYCSDTVRWTMLGAFEAEGTEAIRKFFNGNPTSTEEADIRLGQTIAEGDQVASTGTMKMKEKDGHMVEYAFCDIYRFEGEKIAEMSSYLVKLGGEAKK